MALFKYFSQVLNLPSAEDTNIEVAATKVVNAEVQHVMEDIHVENEAAQHERCKHKVYTAFTPEPKCEHWEICCRTWQCSYYKEVQSRTSYS